VQQRGEQLRWTSCFCLGFPIRTEQDVLNYAQKFLKHGEHLEAESGKYVRWEAGNGVELWARLDHEGAELLGHGLHPHFSGDAVARVGLTEQVPDSGAGPLEGGFYGWVNPYDEPLVFEDPEDGYPVHHRGVAEGEAGLYFLALPFQHTLTSALIGGVGADARYVAEQLRSRDGSGAQRQRFSDPFPDSGGARLCEQERGRT